tara:strand:- start:1574 stop:1831 length:258 start_codon:yes stop_codon:yes gene_type:complete
MVTEGGKTLKYRENPDQFVNGKEAYDNGYNDGYVDGRQDSDYCLEKILYDVKQKGYDKVGKIELLNAIKHSLGYRLNHAASEDTE